MPLLGQVRPQHPANRDVLTALVSIAREKGDFAAALRHGRELLTLAREDEHVRAVVSDLEKRRAH
jgi:Flp pilus assembly protein TadD